MSSAKSFFKNLADKLQSSGIQSQAGDTGLPVFALIGYLPDVTEKDAESYAKSVALSHMEMLDRSYFHVMPFAQGFMYEVHEGGQAKSYLPDIIHSLEAQKASEVQIPRVFVRTSRRVVRIELEQLGPQAMLMPEACEESTTEGVTQSTNMRPIENPNTHFLVLGTTILVVGLVLAIGGTMVRELNKIEIPEAVERTSPKNLPISQWKLLENVEPGQYIAALKFENNRWTTIRKSISDAPSPATAGTPIQAPK